MSVQCLLCEQNRKAKRVPTLGLRVAGCVGEPSRVAQDFLPERPAAALCAGAWALHGGRLFSFSGGSRGFGSFWAPEGLGTRSL